jgi:hypothetical protein
MTTADTQRPGEYAALLRADFASFAQHCFRELKPRTPFVPNWHFRVTAAKLEAVRTGRSRQLIINLPPRHLKSQLASVRPPHRAAGSPPRSAGC